MLDTIIANGTVVTPQGAGLWEIGIKGDQIVAVGLPGSLPRDGARVIDAAGLIVTPGGIDPHTHLAHAIMSHPDQPSATLGPEDDTRGMAYGGTTTHIDFVYVRPGVDNIQSAIEQRAARWKGNAHVDYAYHITMSGALDLKMFTTNVLPPHPKRQGNRLDFGRIGYLMEKIAPAGGLMVVHGEDEDLVQFNYEKFRAEGRMDGTNLHLVHTKLSELLAFRRTVTLARAMSAAVYFVHTSAKEGVDTIGEARANGQPVYGETLHQYACFNAEYYKTPRGFCSHTYPSLKFPEDQEALWRGLVHDGLATLATDEYPTNLEMKLRGRTIEDVTGGNVGAEARLGIAFTEGVGKRGMSLERFADITATNAAKIFGLYPRKGVIAPGSDADFAVMDPAIRKTLTKDDFHVTDYSPWEGWQVSGWPAVTILRGRMIAERGKLMGSTSDGQLLLRKLDPQVLQRPAC